MTGGNVVSVYADKVDETYKELYDVTVTVRVSADSTGSAIIGVVGILEDSE